MSTKLTLNSPGRKQFDTFCVARRMDSVVQGLEPLTSEQGETTLLLVGAFVGA